MDFEKLISENIDNPAQLGKLFRKDPEQFKVSFSKVFAENSK